METELYRCPECTTPVRRDEGGLICKNGHSFELIDAAVADFFHLVHDSNDYSGEKAAEINDNAMAWLFETFRVRPDEFRESLVGRLKLREGQSVLITGAGACDDIPFVAKSLGYKGSICVQDISKEMLMVGRAKCAANKDLNGIKIQYSLSDATTLPYNDGTFDAVYHFGGINLFSDINAGVLEMNRVAKDEGRVVFGDEGLAPWLRHTEYGAMVLNNNPLCEFEPNRMLHALPATAREVTLSWEMGFCFYVIDYTVAKSDLPLDSHVEHKGARGGTMYKRYHGQFEGVDRSLRDQIYARAEERGMSRVEYLEAVLESHLGEKKV